MSEKTKKKKFSVAQLAPIAVGAIVGLLLARFTSISEMNIGLFVFSMVCLVVFFLLTIIIHEAGHLVMGLATGYKFVSFRIGSLTWIKENGRLRLRRFSVAGTSGQCLMMPDETDSPEDYPYFWYNFGGVLFNLITAVLCGIPLLFVGNTLLRTALITMAVVSPVLGIINLIPMGKLVANDGKNLIDMRKSPAMRRIMYQQLRINGLLYQGVNPLDIPEELMKESAEDENVGLHKCIIPILKASAMLGEGKFAEAEDIFRKYAESEEVHMIYRLESAAELLFCRIMNGAESEEIDSIYDDELKNYVNNSAKTHISKRRLLYAYNLIYLKNYTAAESVYNGAMKMKETYPCKGELEFELDLIEYVKNFRQ